MKVDKQISFPKPKSGLLYTPTEFDECLIKNGDSQYRRFIIKQVIKKKIIPINNFCVVFRNIKKYRRFKNHKNYIKLD